MLDPAPQVQSYSVMVSKDLELGDKKSRKEPQLLYSCRLTFAILCLLSTLMAMLLRHNINFGLVCMVKSTSSIITVGDHDLNFQNTSTSEDLLSLEEQSWLNVSRNSNQINEVIEFSDTEYCTASGDFHNSSVPAKQEGVFEWDKSTMGNILGSFYYGYVFTNIVGGWVSDKFGGRMLFIASIGVYSMLTVLNPLAAIQGPEYLFLVRFIQGFSQGAFLPLINVLAARWMGQTERGFLLSIAYGGFTIGGFVTNPLCAYICKTLGWSYIFYFTGGIGFIWCILSYFLMYNWPEEHPRISQEELEFLQKNRAVQPGAKNSKKLIIPWRHILLSVPVNAVHVAHFCTMWSFLTFSMYVPLYYKDILKMDVARNGILSSVPYFGLLILHWFSGRIFDSVRRRQYCSVTNLRKIFNTLGLGMFTLSVALIGIIPCGENTPEIVVLGIITSFWELALTGGYFFSVFEICPRFSGIVTGITNTFGVLPGFLSPVLVGYLVSGKGTRDEWLLVFYIGAAACAFGIIVYALFGSAELQPWADIRPKEKEMVDLNEKLLIKNGSKPDNTVEVTVEAEMAIVRENQQNGSA